MLVEAAIVRLRLAETFVISRESADWSDVVQVELRHGGHVGRGEAAPIERYDETAESALAFIQEHASLLGDDPFALEEIGTRLEEVPGEHAAKSALDAALHDLQGKLLGVPVWRLLGLPRTGPPTSWTIWLGDPDDMARRTERVEGRFRRLKLKLGGGDGLDVERVRAVRSRTRGAAPGRRQRVVVARRGARRDPAARGARRPVRRAAAARRRIPAPRSSGSARRCPVYVDEDCHTLADVAHCAEIAHGINIKLAKSGGIREAVRMAHAARALGLGVMLGCMVESGLGIAAACVVAPLCDHVDLDGNLLLAEDPCPGVTFADGVQVPSEEAGLGVG